MKAQQRNIGGHTIRWIEHGTGSPVVLVHGIPTSARLWRHVMPLVKGQSLAWEMPGYGTSIPEGQGRDLSLSSQANYMLQWLDSMDLPEKPVLVGHDLGGGVAQIAATRAPERFAGLVLTNAVAYDSWPIPSVKVMQRIAGLLAHSPRRCSTRPSPSSSIVATTTTAWHWSPSGSTGPPTSPTVPPGR